MILYAVYRNADKIISEQKLPQHVISKEVVGIEILAVHQPVVDIVVPIIPANNVSVGTTTT